MKIGVLLTVLLGLLALAVVGVVGWYMYMKVRFKTV